MKRSPQQTPPRGILTLKTAPPFARAGAKGAARKSRKFVPLDASLYGPAQKRTQQTSNVGETYQDTAAPRVGSMPDLWAAKEATITRVGPDGESVETTPFRWKVEKRGRPRKGPTLNERPKRTQPDVKEHRARVSLFKSKLTKEIEAALKKLPRAIQKDPQRFSAAREKIRQEILSPFITLKRDYRGTAARQVETATRSLA